MLPYLAMTLLGVSVCTITIQYVIRLGVMDIPVQRSAHSVPTPKGGGIGIMLGVLCGLLVFFLFHPPTASLLMRISVVLAAAATLSLFSWRDDIQHFPAFIKLAVQGAAVLLVTLAALWPLAFDFLNVATLILACGIVILVTNTLNFMDGINGLAGGTVAICGFFFAPLLSIMGLGPYGALFFLLSMCCLTFLFFNFPRARLFMGDVGSQPCGLLLGWSCVIFAKDTSWFYLPAFMLAGLLFDVIYTLGRRAWRRENLMMAHRGHLYQIAIRVGVRPTMVTFLHWIFVLWGAWVGLMINGVYLALIAVIAPQIFWAAYVHTQARKHDVKP